MLSPEKPTRLIEHRIESATAKFHDLRKILTNGRISARTRGRYMNAFVRSKLCYNIATWNNPDHFVNTLDVVWHRMLRKVVKNGFKRKADSKAFIYSNKDLLRITGFQSIQFFSEKQLVKWLAHCVRMENDALQKLSLFMITTKKNYKSVWSRIESKLGMDRQQFWKLDRDKPSFNRYINSRYGSSKDESFTRSMRMYVPMYAYLNDLPIRGKSRFLVSNFL